MLFYALIYALGWGITVPKMYRACMMSAVRKRSNTSEGDVVFYAVSCSFGSLLWPAILPFLLAFGFSGRDGGRRFSLNGQLEFFREQERRLAQEKRDREARERQDRLDREAALRELEQELARDEQIMLGTPEVVKPRQVYMSGDAATDELREHLRRLGDTHEQAIQRVNEDRIQQLGIRRDPFGKTRYR